MLIVCIFSEQQIFGCSCSEPESCVNSEKCVEPINELLSAPSVSARRLFSYLKELKEIKWRHKPQILDLCCHLTAETEDVFRFVIKKMSSELKATHLTMFVPSKPQQYNKRKAANPHVCEAGTMKGLSANFSVHLSQKN